ncbi:fatty acid desaturase [Chlorogloeopsis sp. ULAP01]|uniref:fatty acid desaturase family protein n=1 Tax=Chlorogloeopsis sp. ULAP01 TaxID=3056483 RepID=UPI0025AB280A|nr:fatty acid desaturase [Chlorogloeopsis sp. ULAP01]MDM9380347.1 fatty acid desaturase [Chlorogloeopsis sp. ULAP01]
MGDRTMTSTTSLSQELQQVTADLHRVNAWAGLLRFSVIGLIFFSLVTLAWSVSNTILFVSVTALAGVFYAFWFICTHDMIHRTLTGWTWFDSVMSRLITWPMLWPYSLYSELHRLHHSWNGIDLRDPERVQWTWQEYQQAHPLLQWYVCYQWIWDIFLLSGFGMIVKTFTKAVRFQKLVPRIRRQMLLDLTGMLIVNGVLLTIVILQGELLHYLLFWLILERIMGMIGQTRDHLEHYGLWGKFTSHQLTQLYACRNLKTSSLIGWLMGGLNYHAVHHAFPNIPFNRLPEAYERIQSILQKRGLPLMQMEPGYLQSTYWFSRHPSLIGDINQSEPTCRHQMILV